MTFINYDEKILDKDVIKMIGCSGFLGGYNFHFYFAPISNRNEDNVQLNPWNVSAALLVNIFLPA